jgi:hypothetical protein
MSRRVVLGFVVGLLALASLVFGTGIGASRAGATATCVAPASATQAMQSSHIMWYKARHHAGQRRTVRGPVKSTKFARGSKGRPTFLNIGRKYPSKKRFTVVIWGEYRHNFSFRPERHYRGHTLDVKGRIRMYKGIAQITVRGPSAIHIVK